MATMKPKKNPITKIIGNVGKAAVKAAKKPAATKKLVTKQIAAEKEWAAKEYGQFATHPGAASVKSNRRLTKQNKWSTDRQIKRYQKQEAKETVKGNARGLKAANKPTKASKTLIGNNKKVSVEYRRELLKNREKPARPNRTRLGNTARSK